MIVGKLLRKVIPGYPWGARVVGETATIVIQATLNTEGSVVDARILQGGHPDLERAAVEAAKRWRFTPTTINGNPGPAYAEITVWYFRES